jgi:hypothetical protein
VEAVFLTNRRGFRPLLELIKGKKVQYKQERKNKRDRYRQERKNKRDRAAEGESETRASPRVLNIFFPKT